MPVIEFTLETLQKEKDRLKVLDPGWYNAKINGAPSIAPSKDGGSTNYVFKIEFKSGKTIYHNLNTKATGFWYSFIAAAFGKTKEAQLAEWEAAIKAGGKVDLNDILSNKLQGKTFKTYAIVEDYQGNPQNKLQNFAPWAAQLQDVKEG